MSTSDPGELTLSQLINATRFAPPSRRELRSSRSTTGPAGESEFTGRHRGTGIDLDSIGLFQDGDDPRHIDWSATARTGRAHVRRFLATVHRPVSILIDLRASMFFATRPPLLAAQACLQAAGLSAHLLRQREPISLMAFNDAGLCPVPGIAASRSMRMRAHALNTIFESYRAGLNVSETAPATLDDGLNQAWPSIPFHHDVVLVSDFSTASSLRPQTLSARRRYSIHGLVVNDPVFNGGWRAGVYPARESAGTSTLALRISRDQTNTQGSKISQWRLALQKQLHTAGFGLVWEGRSPLSANAS